MKTTFLRLKLKDRFTFDYKATPDNVCVKMDKFGYRDTVTGIVRHITYDQWPHMKWVTKIN